MKIKMSKKTVIIGLTALIAVAGIGGVILVSGAEKGKNGNVETMSLTQGTLYNSISVSGTVESKNSQGVYATVNGYLKKVNVEVDDKVKAGDVLAVIDMDSASLDLANQRTKLQPDSQNAELISAETAVSTAKADLDQKKEDYEYNKSMFEAGGVAEQVLTQSKTALDNAEQNYDKAVASLKGTQAKVSSDKKSQSISMQKLQDQIADGVIRAPFDGTVTAVYAKEGSPANGLLFMVEDTGTLEITTYVKEYDVSSVAPGQRVVIKSDGTGKKEIEGVVSSVAGAAAKDASGQNLSSSNVEFETKITVTDADSGLKIGMNARMEIVLDERQDVFAVPYEGITKNGQGEDVIFIVEESGKKDYTAKEIVVETGMEAEFDVEISSPKLTEGMMVITDASGIQDGMKVKL